MSLFSKTDVSSLRVNSPRDRVDVLLQSESEVVVGIERSSFPRLNALLLIEYRLPKILFVSVAGLEINVLNFESCVSDTVDDRFRDHNAESRSD